MSLKWRSPGVFYGWWVVAAAFFIALYTGGTVFYSFTAIFEPIAYETGWTYTQISLAASLRGLETGILVPVTGFMVDRLGPRRVAIGGAIIGAAGMVLLSRTHSLGVFYLAFVLIAVAMSCCTVTVLMTAVANWFRRRIGIASGIVSAGFGFGGLLVPVVVKLIDAYGWRATMALVALGMLIIIIPLSLALRHRPEDYGFLPDGRKENDEADNHSLMPPETVEPEMSAKQAFKSSVFWRIAIAFTLNITIVHGVMTHVMPYLTTVGVARTTSSLVATAVPLTSVIGRLGFGWLGDRVDRRLVAGGAFVVMGLGVLCFAYASATGISMLLLFLLLFGIGYGGTHASRPILMRHYFGRRHFGAIMGLAEGINLLGGVLGPFLAGWTYDTWGSYHGIWLVLAGLAAVALIIVISTSEPCAKEEPVTKTKYP